MVQNCRFTAGCDEIQNNIAGIIIFHIILIFTCKNSVHHKMKISLQIILPPTPIMYEKVNQVLTLQLALM